MSSEKLDEEMHESYLIDLVKETVAKRGESYADPTRDFTRISDLMNALFCDFLKPGCCFKPQDVAKIQILLKLSRSMHREIDDNILDIMGYSHCWDLILRKEKDR